MTPLCWPPIPPKDIGTWKEDNQKDHLGKNIFMNIYNSIYLVIWLTKNILQMLLLLKEHTHTKKSENITLPKLLASIWKNIWKEKDNKEDYFVILLLFWVTFTGLPLTIIDKVIFLIFP